MDIPINWQLLAKFLSGECNYQEMNRVQVWLEADPKNKEMIETLRTAWNISEPNINISNTQQLWQQLSEKAGIDKALREKSINTEKKPDQEPLKWPFTLPIFTVQIWRYAAVFLICLLSVLYFFSDDILVLLGMRGSSDIKTVTIGNAQRDNITLSDGSNIVLDAGSKFSYPSKFTGNTREVFLAGEAFFEVSSDPEKPFIINADHAVIKVLGTKFNVRAWQQEGRVTVTVAEGRVSLYPEKQGIDESVTLSKGYTSTLPVQGRPTVPQLVDIRKSWSWMHNEVYFEDKPLREILGQLERWYDVKFEVKDSTVIDDRLTVHLTEKPLEDHLILIGALVDAHFIRAGKVYRLVMK